MADLTGSWAIVVVNYASHALLEQNFTDPDHPNPAGSSAAADPTSPAPTVVVVDNFSSAAELAALTALAERRGWVLVPSPRNVGFGAAVNLGAAAAFERGCQAVLLVNPDATVSARTARTLIEGCLDAPLTAVCPSIVDPAGRLVFGGSELGLTTGRIRGLATPRRDASGALSPGQSRQAEASIPWLSGACLAIHRDLFVAVGGFDESYFMYWEDLDFSYRVRQRGGSLQVRLDLVVVHDEGGTQGPRRGRSHSTLYYFYNTRNRLLFAARHLPRRAVGRWLLSTPAVSWEILMRGGRRQLLRSPRTLLSAVGGSVAGASQALRRLAHIDRPATAEHAERERV